MDSIVRGWFSDVSPQWPGKINCLTRFVARKMSLVSCRKTTGTACSLEADKVLADVQSKFQVENVEHTVDQRE
jgi:hypothetical protein